MAGVKVRVYLLECGTEWRAIDVWPIGTEVRCPAHPGAQHRIARKRSWVEEAPPWPGEPTRAQLQAAFLAARELGQVLDVEVLTAIIVAAQSAR